MQTSLFVGAEKVCLETGVLNIVLRTCLAGQTQALNKRTRFVYLIHLRPEGPGGLAFQKVQKRFVPFGRPDLL